MMNKLGGLKTILVLISVVAVISMMFVLTNHFLVWLLFIVCISLLCLYVPLKRLCPAIPSHPYETQLLTHQNVRENQPDKAANNIFALISNQQEVNLSSLQSELVDVFSTHKVSIKHLKKHRLSITLLCANSANETHLFTRLMSVCEGHTHDLEFGACLYREPCQQLNVYQLAELALAIAKTKHAKRGHVLKLNQTNLALLQYSLPSMLNDILNHQFLLLFTPVFSVHGEALLCHHVEITIRDQKIGLCDVKRLLMGCFDSEKLIALDKHLLKQLIKTLLLDKSTEPVQLCLDVNTWQSESAMTELLAHLVYSNHQHIIQLSILESELVGHFNTIKQQLLIAKKQGVAVFVERCQGSIMACHDVALLISGISTDAELWQTYSDALSPKPMMAFTQFAKQHHLSLFSAGVSVSEELDILKQCEFEGACGSYFQHEKANSALGLH